MVGRQSGSWITRPIDLKSCPWTGLPCHEPGIILCVGSVNEGQRYVDSLGEPISYLRDWTSSQRTGLLSVCHPMRHAKRKQWQWHRYSKKTVGRFEAFVNKFHLKVIRKFCHLCCRLSHAVYCSHVRFWISNDILLFFKGVHVHYEWFGPASGCPCRKYHTKLISTTNRLL